MTIGAIGNNYSVYGAYSAYSTSGLSGASGVDAAATIGNQDAASSKKVGRASSPEECQTCKNRKYQDGSNEADVSFKNATHVSPNAAGAAVRAHEGQHVSNAYQKAAEGNGKVINASVSIHTAVCPECGRTYVSGGTTNTMIKYSNESNPYQQSKKSQDSLALRGANLNFAV